MELAVGGGELDVARLAGEAAALLGIAVQDADDPVRGPAAPGHELVEGVALHEPAHLAHLAHGVKAVLGHVEPPVAHGDEDAVVHQQLHGLHDRRPADPKTARELVKGEILAHDIVPAYQALDNAVIQYFVQVRFNPHMQIITDPAPECKKK